MPTYVEPNDVPFPSPGGGGSAVLPEPSTGFADQPRRPAQEGDEVFDQASGTMRLRGTVDQEAGLVRRHRDEQRKACANEVQELRAYKKLLPAQRVACQVQVDAVEAQLSALAGVATADAVEDRLYLRRNLAAALRSLEIQDIVRMDIDNGIAAAKARLTSL